MAVIDRTDNFLMFRYRPSLGLQVFRVTPDDRTIQAVCQGTTHEFAVNAAMCAGNHLLLKSLVPPVNRLQYVPHSWHDRALYENRTFDENGFETTVVVAEPVECESAETHAEEPSIRETEYFDLPEKPEPEDKPKTRKRMSS